MPEDKKVSWGAGVLDPDLWGRSDLQKWAAGSKKLTNFFVTPRGAASNRPGTLHVDQTKYHVTNGMGKARLIPFIFSDGDAVLCVFTHLAVRFYRWPASLADSYGADYAAGMVPSSWRIGDVELVTPYAYSVLDKIRFAQIGNVMVLTHEDYAAQELRRVTADGLAWTLTEMDFAVPEFPAYGGIPHLTYDTPQEHTQAEAVSALEWFRGTDALPRAKWTWKITHVMRSSDGREYETMPATVSLVSVRLYEEWDPTATYSPIAYVLNGVIRASIVKLSSLPGKVYWAIDYPPVGQGPEAGGNAWWAEASVDANGVESLSGTVVESLSGMLTQVAVYPERAQRIEWGDTFRIVEADSPADTDDQIIETRVYRGRDGGFGFIGSTTEDFFIDIGAGPDYANPPPAGENPFEVYDADGAFVRTEHPITCAFHQERLLLGGTTERPNWVWGSAVGEFTNFDRIVPADPADSYSFEIAASELEAVRAIIPRRQLLVLASGSEFVVEGDGPIIHPAAAINPIPITSHGSAAMRPVKVGSDLMVLDNLSVKPVAMQFQNEAGGYELNDIAVLAAHLFNNKQIKAMAYAKTPYSILWVVRNDGKLLSLTYVKEHELIAWCEHEISGGDFYDIDTTLDESVRKGSGGFVEDVCVIPEQDTRESGVYLVVRRGTGRCIERLAKRNITDIRRAVILDSATVFEIRNARSDPPDDGDLDCVIEDTYGWDGDTVHQVMLSFTRYDLTPVSTYPIEVGIAVQFDHPTDPDAAPLRIELTVNNGDGTFRGEVINPPVEPTDWFLETLTAWNHLFHSVPVVGRLGGQDLTALADGRVVTGLSVVANAVDFGDLWVAIAAIGLPFVSDWEALDLDQNESKKKIAESVFIETSGARGGYVGASVDSLVEVIDRTVQSSYGVLPMGRQEKLITVPDKWKFKAPGVFRQTAPLPVTLLKFIRNYKLGG